MFRITITSFLDAYNFDVRRLMKCCIHHVLPSGHVIPFCAYNVLYREGHVVLPALRDAGVLHALTASVLICRKARCVGSQPSLVLPADHAGVGGGRGHLEPAHADGVWA